MALQLEIRPLQRGDDRGRFTCGQEDLDRFFRHYAGQNQFNLHLAVTYVAILDGVPEAAGGLRAVQIGPQRIHGPSTIS